MVSFVRHFFAISFAYFNIHRYNMLLEKLHFKELAVHNQQKSIKLYFDLRYFQKTLLLFFFLKKSFIKRKDN